MEMVSLSNRKGKILRLLAMSGKLSAPRIAEELGKISLTTVKRDLAELADADVGYAVATGVGRSSGYVRTPLGTLFTPFNAHEYCSVEADKRAGKERYDDSLFSQVPENLFFSEELAQLQQQTEQYKKRADELSATLAKKELERFIIELSWKSSNIEGNTYTLLDTERLVREGIEAPGHTHEEAVMILNHKRAFEFTYQNAPFFSGTPTHATIEEVHRLLTEGLSVGRGVRKQVVGIVGTNYRPLDNQYQIQEALDALSGAISRADNAYTKTLIALLGLSYIQPFEDGNKRTAQLVANALLLAQGYAPISYRSVDEVVYREAMLVFYETHSIVPFKELFIEQYLFSAKQYGVQNKL